MGLPKPTSASSVLALLKARHSADFFVPECKDGPTHGATHLRLDAWVMARSWAHPKFTGYEIKVTRSDFLRDDKLQRYLPLCNELYVVAPPGVVLSTSELPPGVGHLEVSKTGTRLFTKSKASYREIEPPISLMVYVLMCRTSVHGDSGGDGARGYWEAWLQQKADDRSFGRIVSKEIRSELLRLRRVNTELDRENTRYSELKSELERRRIVFRSSAHYAADEIERSLKAERAVLVPKLREAAESAARSLNTLLAEADKVMSDA